MADSQCILVCTEQWKHIPQRTIQWLLYIIRSTLLKFCDSHGAYIHYRLGEHVGSVVVSDSGARGRGFETHLWRVVSLSKTLYSQKVLVIPRQQWLCPDMTEKLLTGTLSLNTNKQIITDLCYRVLILTKW